MLSQFAPAEVFAFLLVFVRIGTMVMLMPALGETSIPAQVRLTIALALSLVMYPTLKGGLPGLPTETFVLFGLIAGEFLIGLVVAGTLRLLMSAVHTAGIVIAYQSGLAAAIAFDPSQGAQSSIVGTFLMVLAVTLIFVTNTHHLLIAALYDSYALMPAGDVPMLGDTAQLAITTVAKAFRIGVEMSVPFLLFGLIFNIGLGLIARLMPQLQVFFIAMPLNISLGFVVLMFSIAGSMYWFIQKFEAQIMTILR